MKISVVVRTYQRPQAAIDILEELNKQQYRDFEVILVCQGEKSDCRKIKDSVKAAYPFKIVYLSEASAPRARNEGINNAGGEVVLFLDDDERPYPDLIQKHLANYSDPGVAIVGGKVLEEKYEQDVPEAKIGTVRKFDGYVFCGFTKDIKRSVMHVKGGNMSVRKKVAQEVGGFDRRFAGTAEYEELDFCLRVFRKGYKIIYEPEAVIEHFALPFGGCKVYSQEERIYWLYRNHSLAFLNNLPKFFYPILLTEYLVRIIRRSIIWRSPRIIASGLKGITDGWKSHFTKTA